MPATETAPTIDWQTTVLVGLMLLIAAFLGLVGGYAWGDSDDLDPSGRAGQVYVPGYGWVADDDHGKHQAAP